MISLVTLLAATTALASPIEVPAKIVKMPVKQVSNFTSIKNIVSKGQARIKKVNGEKLLATGVSSVSSGAVTNEDVTYVAPVTIGGSTWQLIVDTGCMILPFLRVPLYMYVKPSC